MTIEKVEGLYNTNFYVTTYNHMIKHKKIWHIDNAGTLWYLPDLLPYVELAKREYSK